MMSWRDEIVTSQINGVNVKISIFLTGSGISVISLKWNKYANFVVLFFIIFSVRNN